MNHFLIRLFSLFQVEHCRLPGLAIALTLETAHQESEPEGISDLVAFVSGLLLGNDVNVRTWFSLFVRTGQKVGEQFLHKVCTFYA